MLYLVCVHIHGLTSSENFWWEIWIKPIQCAYVSVFRPKLIDKIGFIFHIFVSSTSFFATPNGELINPVFSKQATKNEREKIAKCNYLLAIGCLSDAFFYLMETAHNHKNFHLFVHSRRSLWSLFILLLTLVSFPFPFCSGRSVWHNSRYTWSDWKKNFVNFNKNALSTQKIFANANIQKRHNNQNHIKSKKLKPHS